MAEGTKDVSTDLSKRTDSKGSDRLLMVNPETKEVQYVEASDLPQSLSAVSTPSDVTFIIE
ncbi:hypothetical protein [Pedobacter antarcticus]|uniref:hypothetical protein n=1 Tax=Pedobacter antarcticus TaxID=34086 RepID=UPI0029304F73|nr:hypothetical protein [Pedobacter antarcticus]